QAAAGHAHVGRGTRVRRRRRIRVELAETAAARAVEGGGVLGRQRRGRRDLGGQARGRRRRAARGGNALAGGLELAGAGLRQAITDPGLALFDDLVEALVAEGVGLLHGRAGT